MNHVKRNKEIVRRYIEELWNGQQFELIDEILAPDLLSHNPDGTDEQGNQRFLQVIPGVRKAFPDLHLTIEDMVAEEDRVAYRLTIRGTHEGEFAGVAPTHKRVTATEMFIMRLSGGRIIESWYVRDQEGLIRQLREGQ